MNAKLIVNAFLGVSLLAAAGTGFAIYSKKESIARAERDAAEAKESAAKDQARKARSEEAAAASEAEAKKASLKLAQENRQTKVAEAEKAKADAEKAKADKERQVAEKAKAVAAANQASAERDAEKAKLATAKAEADKAKELAKAEASRQATAEASKEKARLDSERVIAEAKLRELKESELIELEQQLLAYKRELDERERELRPEKTIEDLVWVSKEDMVIAEDGTVKRQEKKVYLKENDITLAKETRQLAKTERLLKELRDERFLKSRNIIVSKLETLYRDALKDDRIPDADYYKKTILSLYPDWDEKSALKESEEEKK